MSAAYVFHRSYFDNCLQSLSNGEGDVWADKPTYKGTLLYSFVIPAISVVAILINSLSLIILMKKEFTASVYTYLAVISLSDLLSSFLLFFGGLSRGLFWRSGWEVYDSLICLPLSGIINCIGISALVALTLDRIIYLWDPLRCKRPLICRRSFARKLIFICVILSILVNMPYWFIFTLSDADQFGVATTDFFDSRFYIIYSWIYFIIFTIIPGIIVTCGNIYLIRSLKRYKKLKKQKIKECSKTKDTDNLTMTLIAVIFAFLLSNVPGSLLSNANAINMLFNGNHNRVHSKTIEYLRMVFTLVLALKDANDFFIFNYFCPSFNRALKKMCERKRRKERTQSVQINVFILDKYFNAVKIDEPKDEKALDMVTYSSKLTKLQDNFMKCPFK